MIKIYFNEDRTYAISEYDLYNMAKAGLNDTDMCYECSQYHEEDIEKFCLKLPRYKRPKQIIFADIPRNPTGKIEKPKLRKIYCGESLVALQNRS